MNINWTYATTVPLKRPKGASKNRSANFSIFFASICLYNIIGSNKYILMLLENFSDIDIDKNHTSYYLFFGHSLNDFDPIFFGVARFLRAQCHIYAKGKPSKCGE